MYLISYTKNLDINTAIHKTIHCPIIQVARFWFRVRINESWLSKNIGSKVCAGIVCEYGIYR